MPANDEFPRGLTLKNQPAAGGQASITFPAIPGIQWILTEVNVSSIVVGGLGNNIGLTCDVSAIQTLFFLAAPVSTPAWTLGPGGSWTGKIAPPVGQGLIVEISGGVPNWGAFLEATAYPV
jgi:hypothetical protein